MNRIGLAAIVAVAIQLVVPSVAVADPPQKVIVKYRQGASSKKRRLSVESIGGAVLGAIRGQGTKIVAVAGDAVAAAERIARKPGVAWAEPDYELRALAAPNDPLLAQLGGLGLIHAQAAWDALGLSESYPGDGGGRAGSVVVAAAGNDGSSVLDYPAGYPEVVSVAAVDDRGARAWFSNSNADVEIAAPGVDVLSARLGGGYVRESGTSMATPH